MSEQIFIISGHCKRRLMHHTVFGNHNNRLDRFELTVDFLEDGKKIGIDDDHFCFRMIDGINDLVGG